METKEPLNKTENKSQSLKEYGSKKFVSPNSNLQHFQSVADSSPQVREIAQLQKQTDSHTSNQNVVQKKENNTGLPDNLKSGIESLSGYSMDDVKVHYNSSKPAQLNAHAYAQGTDIHLASGQEKHLSHEAWHVVQQKQGRVKPTRQMKEKVNINDDEGLEKEADVMGAQALRVKNVSVVNLENPIQRMLKVHQLEPDAETGRLPQNEVASLDNILTNHHLNPMLFTQAHWVLLQQAFIGLIDANDRLLRAAKKSASKKRPLRQLVRERYDQLIQNATNYQIEDRANDWALLGDPQVNGGRLELEIRPQNYRQDSPTYNLNVSLTRHLFANYWVLQNDNVTQSEELNTLAYCNEAAFTAAFRRFGQAIANALNAREPAHHHDAFDARGLEYDRAGGLEFQTDRAGYNVHSFPVDTEGSAITLNRQEHHSLKIVLRGMSSDQSSNAFRQGRVEWENIAHSERVIAILTNTNNYHDIVRLFG